MPAGIDDQARFDEVGIEDGARWARLPPAAISTGIASDFSRV